MEKRNEVLEEFDPPGCNWWKCMLSYNNIWTQYAWLCYGIKYVVWEKEKKTINRVPFYLCTKCKTCWYDATDDKGKLKLFRRLSAFQNFSSLFQFSRTSLLSKNLFNPKKPCELQKSGPWPCRGTPTFIEAGEEQKRIQRPSQQDFLFQKCYMLEIQRITL